MGGVGWGVGSGVLLGVLLVGGEEMGEEGVCEGDMGLGRGV